MTHTPVRIDSAVIDHDVIVKAADIIKGGGIVVFPTRCLYGLAADAFNAEAVEKIYRIKRRSAYNPILVLIPDRGALFQLTSAVMPAAQNIMDHFWPGQVTLVFKSLETVSENLTAGTGKIGIRQPDHAVAAALAAAVGRPMTGTSANISQTGGCNRIEDLDAEIRSAVDMIIDAGPLEGGQGSTVVDVTVEPVRILREGVVPSSAIFELF